MAVLQLRGQWKWNRDEETELEEGDLLGLLNAPRTLKPTNYIRSQIFNNLGCPKMLTDLRIIP